MNSTNFSSKDYLDIDGILKEKRISKTDLANKLGVPRQSIYSYLKGNVSLEKLVNIADALEVNITELFEPAKTNEFTCPNCGTKLKVSKE